MSQPCEVFKREGDIEVMHELCNLLRDGGLDSFREMKKMTEEYNSIKKAGFGLVVKAFWIGLLFIAGLGAYAIATHTK